MSRPFLIEFRESCLPAVTALFEFVLGAVTFAMFGERITCVGPGSPAYNAGLEVGDYIVGYYSGNTYRRFFQSSEFSTALESSYPNIRLKVINVRDGQFVNVNVYFDGRYTSGQGGYGNNGYNSITGRQRVLVE